MQQITAVHESTYTMADATFVKQQPADKEFNYYHISHNGVYFFPMHSLFHTTLEAP